MNKRIKKKYTKEVFKFYKGEMIWKNHLYCGGHLPRTKNIFHGPRVMLCYDHTGNEVYFDTISQAVHYIDSMRDKFKPISVKDKYYETSTSVSNNNGDDCSFDVVPW